MIPRRFVLLMLLLAVAGCTTTSHRADMAGAAPEGTRLVAMGPVVARDAELWSSYAVVLRRAMLARLAVLRGADGVADAGGSAAPAGSVLVSGELTEFDKGNVALRWIIGFGAGRARAVAQFRLVDAAGNPLLSFSTTKEYAGGAGIGGADLVDIETLVRELGEKAAEAVDAWLRTGKLP